VAFSPDGATLASGSVSKEVRLWDAAAAEDTAAPPAAAAAPPAQAASSSTVAPIERTLKVGASGGWLPWPTALAPGLSGPPSS
jgi:hypothetical protein